MQQVTQVQSVLRTALSRGSPLHARIRCQSSYEPLLPVRICVSKQILLDSLLHHFLSAPHVIEHCNWLGMKELLKAVRGMRNGVEYGGKVRFVHAVVMTLLFKKLSKQEIKNIFRMAFDHSSRLGFFVLLFKIVLSLLHRYTGTRSFNHFISGLVCAGFTFGKRIPVNEQIVFYMFSRILVASVSRFYKAYYPAEWMQKQLSMGRRAGYIGLAGLVWGLVMWLFEVDKKVIQPGLRNSMQYLYVESDEPVGKWTDLIPYWPK